MIDERIGVELSDFPVGDVNPASEWFSGETYLSWLSTEQVPTINVTFAPGCRNNWHIHHATEGGGQMLICVFGRGWYQEWGKPARPLREGSIVVIPPEVKHWHGARKDSWFSHISVEVPGTGTSNEWLEPVTDEQYEALTK